MRDMDAKQGTGESVVSEGKDSRWEGRSLDQFHCYVKGREKTILKEAEPRQGLRVGGGGRLMNMGPAAPLRGVSGGL